jgi:hypothetical protein
MLLDQIIADVERKNADMPPMPGYTHDDSCAAVDLRTLRLIRNHMTCLEAALRVADRAMNPPDLGGISLEQWNKRLRSATEQISEALDRVEK